MIAKHTLLYFASKFVPAIASMLAIMFYTRQLEPQDYGRYSLTVAVAMGLNAVVYQWLNLSLGRYLPEQSPQQQTSWLSTAVLGWAGITVISCLFVWLLPWPEFFPDAAIVFSFVSLLAAAQGWFDLSVRLDNINFNPVRYGIAAAVKSTLALLGGLSALALGFKVEGILAAMISGLLLATLFQWQHWGKVRFSLVRFSLLKQMFSYGAPLTLTFLMVFFIDVSGRLFLNHFSGAYSVGVFSAAYEFTQYVIGTLLVVIHLAAYPVVIARYTEEGDSGAQSQLKTTFELIFALALPTCVGFSLLANEISALFLGQDYREGAVSIIPWIAMALLFGTLRAYYFDYAFHLAKSTLYQLACMAVAAFFVVVSNFLLIPLYGLHGAAYASCIGFVVALTMSIVLGRRVFVMPALPYKSVLQILLATALMACIVSLITTEHPFVTLVVKAVAGAAVYLVVLLWCNFYQCRTRIKERYFVR
jgi:O-antigen/teichoic acid export membrane protein